MATNMFGAPANGGLDETSWVSDQSGYQPLGWSDANRFKTKEEAEKALQSLMGRSDYLKSLGYDVSGYSVMEVPKYTYGLSGINEYPAHYSIAPPKPSQNHLWATNAQEWRVPQTVGFDDLVVGTIRNPAIAPFVTLAAAALGQGWLAPYLAGGAAAAGAGTTAAGAIGAAGAGAATGAGTAALMGDSNLTRPALTGAVGGLSSGAGQAIGGTTGAVAGGALGGASSAAIQGGDSQAILKGGLMGGAQGLASSGISNLGKTYGVDPWVGSTASGALMGGLRGGSEGAQQGALSGLFSGLGGQYGGKAGAAIGGALAKQYYNSQMQPRPYQGMMRQPAGNSPTSRYTPQQMQQLYAQYKAQRRV